MPMPINNMYSQKNGVITSSDCFLHRHVAMSQNDKALCKTVWLNYKTKQIILTSTLS